MLLSPQGGLILRSNLKQLLAKKEVELGRRITQQELAALTHLNRNTITRWMGPEPFERFESAPVIKLCTVLGCAIGDLVVIDKDPAIAAIE